MNQPTAKQIQHWLVVNGERIGSRMKKIVKNDFDQATYAILGGNYASRGRTLFLNGNALHEVRECFQKAAEVAEQSFIMAFDKQSPHYVGNTSQVEWCWSDEIRGVKMMGWAIISTNFKYATKLAKWVQTIPRKSKLRMEVNNYSFGLRDALLGEITSAEKYLNNTLQKYLHRPPVKNDYRRNYYTLSKTLMGILNEDQDLFTEGLDEQLNFYRSYARYEAKDTNEEFFCDNAVALANLAIKQGLKVDIESQYLPKGILIPN